MAFLEVPKTGGGGEFTPVIAYNAKAGRLFLVNREQEQDGMWATTKVDVTMAQPAFAVDFGRLEVGWVHFSAGAAPQWHMAPLGHPIPPKPPSPGQDGATGKAMQFRNGFRIPVAGQAIGGVRELAGNSSAMIAGMNELHTAFEAAPEAAAGKIPVVKLVSVMEVKAGQSSNFQPVFQIMQWVDRPAALGERTVPAPRGGARTQAAPQPQPGTQGAPAQPVPAGASTGAPAQAAPHQSAAVPETMPF